eukprot:CFRG5641T1
MAEREMKAVVPVDGLCQVVQRPIPVPKEGEVLIQVYATALNRADTLIRTGKYPGPKPDVPEVLGLEAAGRIVTLPENGSSMGYKVGDRVMSLLDCGGYAEYVCVDERMLMRVPENLSMYAAAGIPETWLTSFQLLFWNANVKEGSRVLIHAAASGIGTTAVQLCVDMGAVPYVTASSQEKLQVAIALGVDKSHCFSRNEEKEWHVQVKEALKAEGLQGINVILDPVGGGQYAVQNADVLAVDSTWVLFGLMGGASFDFEGVGAPPLFASVLRKRIKLCGTTLKTRSKCYKIKLTEAVVAHCSEKWESRNLTPIIDKSDFVLSDAQKAHEYMESNKNAGKLILVVKEDSDERALFEQHV